MAARASCLRLSPDEPVGIDVGCLYCTHGSIICSFLWKIWMNEINQHAWVARGKRLGVGADQDTPPCRGPMPGGGTWASAALGR